MERILLHVCCGPCALGVIPELRRLGYEPLALLFNPNIHPYKEFMQRKNSSLAVLDSLGVEWVACDDYNQEAFLEDAQKEFGKRCSYCYRTRLGRAAQEAEKLRLENFTTTLTISPWQDHQLIKLCGEKMSTATKTSFRYFDFRPQYRSTRARTLQMGLYSQKYCGCLLSKSETGLE